MDHKIKNYLCNLILLEILIDNNQIMKNSFPHNTPKWLIHHNS